MRNSFKLWLCAASLCLAACQQPPSQREGSSALHVLSTTAMIDDLVGRIVGERAHHHPLIQGEIDPHSYELVKGDDEKIALASLILYNGLGLEHGASLRYHIEHHPHAVGVGDAVQARFPEMLLFIDGQVDPHIWMDISLWSLIVDPIVEALVRMDAEGEALYRANAEALKEQMQSAHQRIVEKLADVPVPMRFLVTSHDAFQYFARAYLAPLEERSSAQWKERCAAPEGIAPDGQLSAADIQRIAQHTIAHRIPVLFPESNVSPDALRKIAHVCQKKGWALRFSKEPLFGDAMGTHSYFAMIEHNADVLVRTWQGALSAHD